METVSDNNVREYKVGEEVSYGLHGKCVVTAIETKQIGNESVSFYSVKTIKNPIAAKSPSKAGPSILIPVSSAASKGLRPLMSKELAEKVLLVISDADYHFNLSETWVSKQKTLEDAIRKEGAIGLAKVVGHLYVMIKRDAVPPGIIVRFFENVYRIFLKELAEAMALAPKDVEPILLRALKTKLSFDN